MQQRDPTRRSEPIFLTDLIGGPVAGEDGSVVGTLEDLGVAMDGPYPRAVAVRLADPGEGPAPWRHLAGPGPPIVAGPPEDARSPRPTHVLWLKRDVMDEQVVDLAGKRVARVGDVELRADGAELRVEGVDVGVGAVLRRLGLAGVAGHIGGHVLPWEGIHLVDGPGHRLLMDSPSPPIAALAHEDLADVVTKLPRPHATRLIDDLPATKREAVRHTLRRRPGRHRFPMHARRRAPS
jgi:sporulation protein YlmC with PRC-barrel domain